LKKLCPPGFLPVCADNGKRLAGSRKNVRLRRIIKGQRIGRSVALTQTEQKNRVHVKIYGEEYTMRGPASPDYMKRAAHYVDEKMRQIGQTNSRLGVSRIAVLTAINLADELFLLRKELQELETILDQKTTR
jgi:cell division protein ZapA